MKEKVIALCGSPRKKGTFQLLQTMQGALRACDLELEIIPVTSLTINPCKGCQKCILKGGCVYQDDMENLLNRLQKARGIILATPVYIGHITGQFKTLLDRTCSWYHRPPLAGKPFLSIVTTAYSGIKETLRYLDKAGMDWGMLPAGHISRNAGNSQSPVTPKEIKQFISLINSNLKTYQPTLRQLMSFSVQKVLAREILDIDRDFWTVQGWDKQDFYFFCRISFFKRLLNRWFYNTLSRNVRKTRIEAKAEGGNW